MKSIRTLFDGSAYVLRKVRLAYFARRKLGMESLEQRQLLAGIAMITEFMAKNDGFFADGDGNTPDWIEIQNIGDTAWTLLAIG